MTVQYFEIVIFRDTHSTQTTPIVSLSSERDIFVAVLFFDSVEVAAGYL